MTLSWRELVAGVEKGDVRALARMITHVENRDSGWTQAMKLICCSTGSARVLGITGPPGSGKSTLTNRIARGLVAKGLKVGIVAIDPSSPFSGGALLGDRLRMRDISTIGGIFIRSMATRGTLGGLCQAARDVVRIMDAFGKDIVLIETVGVGQDEIDVVKAVDFVVVVCVPGQGDGIQALKAGVMEIADLFLVNKADRDGADEVVMDIRSMLELSHLKNGMVPPVLKASATTGEGLETLVDILANTNSRTETEEQRTEDRIKEEILTLIQEELFQYLRSEWAGNGSLQSAVKAVAANTRDPYSAAEEMLSIIRTASMQPISSTHKETICGTS